MNIAKELPCNLPCEQCGSDDISRQYIAVDQKVSNEEYNRCNNRFATGQCQCFKAFRRHIDHKCKVCSYRWQTLPVTKKQYKALVTKAAVIGGYQPAPIALYNEPPVRK